MTPKEKIHDEPCHYTKATRALVIIILGLIMSGLGWLAMEKEALQRDIRRDSELIQAQAVKQGVLETEMKIRLDNIETIAREIRAELKKGN